MNDVIMYSGGLDSFLVHFYLKKHNVDHELLYFNLGAKYNPCEMNLFNSENFKTYVGEPVTVSDCLQMSGLEHEDAYIPNRNILTAIMSHSVTMYDNIWIGGTLSDRVNDNNKHVFEILSNLLSQMHKKTIKIDSPFWMHHKPQLIRNFIEENGWGSFKNEDEARQALVKATFSCYYPYQNENNYQVYYFNDDKRIVPYRMEWINSFECLRCPACFRKCLSLYAGGIFIPMRWFAGSKGNNDLIDMVSKYYKEAVDYITAAEDDNTPFNDTTMLNRMEWTVRYVQRLEKHYGFAKFH